MPSKSERGRLVMALPGILATVFSVIVGFLVLAFAAPSLGRQAEYGYVLSPAAGGLLFILLGLAGGLAATLEAERSRAARRSMILLGLLSLTGFAALAIFREWAACALVIIIAAASWTAWAARRRGTGAALLLFGGLAGFPLGQAAMTFLPYGWKTWAVSGVLLVFCGLLFLAEKYFSNLPVPGGGSGPSMRRGFYLCSLLSIILVILVIAALIHVPADGGSTTADIGILENKDQAMGTGGSAGPGDQNQGLKECDCLKEGKKSIDADALNQSPGSQDGQPGALILAPEDVRTFPRGEAVHFEASSCAGELLRNEQLRYLWRSSLDGEIGRQREFNYSRLSAGWHSITLTIIDSSNTSVLGSIEMGIAEPSICTKTSPRPEYYPVDTPCQDIWPDAPQDCQEFEVCHPELDYIVADAVNCCDGTALPGSACAYACANSGGDRKKCRGLYIIRAFGPDAIYMKGYALFKACCSGYPECTRTCGMDLSGTCAFREGFNENVSHLSCRPDDWGVSAWRSDTNMSENSAVLGLFPTHATVNLLHTGVCIDYAAAVTTALRKAGYSRAEALSTASTGYDLPLLGNHPGHAYNLVRLPGDPEYHIVDTTGNGEGINLEGLPHYFFFTGCFLGQPVRIRVFDWWVGYCNKTSRISYNDAGEMETPGRSEIFGC